MFVCASNVSVSKHVEKAPLSAGKLTYPFVPNATTHGTDALATLVTLFYNIARPRSFHHLDWPSSTPRDEKVNLSNNEITFLPETVEAAWGQVDVLTGKLDPNTVGSPLKAEVIVRGNPFVDAASKRAAAAEEEAAAMDDSQ